MSPLISSIAWVRRGVAAENPERYNLDEKELERVQKLARIELEDAQIELQRASEAAHDMENRSDEEDSSVEEDDNDDSWEDSASDDDRMDEDVIDPEPKKSKSKPNAQDDPDGLAEYNLDNYDEEKIGAGEMLLGYAVEHMADNFGSLWCIQQHQRPYLLSLKRRRSIHHTKRGPSDDEEAERTELQVQSTDNMIVTAKTEDEVSHLDVYIYNDNDENLYVHHDILLPSFPLCLEWLDFPPTSSSSPSTPSTQQQGNFIAVGTFEPEIEIWSLDVTEAIYPSLILGRPDKSAAHVPVPLGTGKKKRKQTKARDPTPEYHVDAVLGLAWNRAHRNILASASADATVKIWDLSSGAGSAGSAGSAVRSFGVHRDKVQSVQWNTVQPEVLLTGSYDHTVRVFDSRDPGKAVGAVVGADVEALRWDPWEAMSFYVSIQTVSLEDGNVHYFDARTLSAIPASGSLPAPTKSRFTLSAHTGAASALDINPHVRGCVATGGADKLVKIWNVEVDGDNVNASMVTSRNLEVGKVFTVGFSPDDPLTLAAAGSKAKLQVWDIGANPGARKSFGSRLPLRQGGWERTREGGGVVGVQSDDEESGEE
ncbi:transducin family protein/WD-40 repeat family protein [Rhizoctonia solani AG-1 IA]|uniref:Transducin family protein/WD-40 repeat family protein n=1 Tax=Thanatephorus cucumeris (strain AG1-IA) TaxID=983506 RepID=L8WV19_THACA|nr:transducin family protein/WD-40 repeat family protein [Rhizoctonia solani AG-1 IA]